MKGIDMNGMIEIQLNGRRVTVIGGPYRDKPEGIKGVKLAQEIDAPYEIKLDIADFSIPDGGDTFVATLKALDVLERDGVIYVGCMGGIGRTGMFIALLVKAIGYYNLNREYAGVRGWWNRLLKYFGFSTEVDLCKYMINEPVAYVREHYLSYAVETKLQERFVDEFEWINFKIERFPELERWDSGIN